jgi:phosphatidylglycerophosphatase A
MRKTVRRWVQKAGSSLLFVGYFPFMSGTVGSAVAVGVLWLVHQRYPALFGPQYVLAHWLVLLGLVALSIMLSADAGELFGSEDPRQVVIDEFAGQMITFFLMPLSWRVLVLGFVLFRFFDVVKPFPVYTMEEIRGGVGITMDDVVAGVCANISLMAIYFAYHALKAAL